tara:strand:+ start:910 stop:1149 length:240 start_codon:yes stop_codon:yes gene_type:complete
MIGAVLPSNLDVDPGHVLTRLIPHLFRQDVAIVETTVHQVDCLAVEDSGTLGHFQLVDIRWVSLGDVDFELRHVGLSIR